jgi:hypothetical protein
MASKSPYTMKLNSIEGKQRASEVKKRGGMYLQMDCVRQITKQVLSEKGRSDICFFWMFALHDFAVMNKKEMDTQMRMWAKQAKDGILTVLEENNSEHTIEGTEGGKIFGLVITPKAYSNMCPISLSLGTMVSGFGYFFTSESNRNAVFEYIKKKSTWTPSEDEKEDE